MTNKTCHSFIILEKLYQRWISSFVSCSQIDQAPPARLHNTDSSMDFRSIFQSKFIVYCKFSNLELLISKSGPMQKSFVLIFFQILYLGSALCLSTDCHAILYLCHYWNAGFLFLHYSFAEILFWGGLDHKSRKSKNLDCIPLIGFLKVFKCNLSFLRIYCHFYFLQLSGIW